MKNFKCLIVDDEKIAREILETYIQTAPQLELIGQCQNAFEASTFLNQEQVDVIFLDIEMPELGGLSFLKTLTRPPKTIVTTAYREFALDGYELNVVDYLLKPISQERFLKAVNKLFHDSPINQASDHVYLKVDGKMVRVDFDNIHYIEGLNNYVKIYLKDQFLISYQKLSYLEQAFPAGKFVRCHRSYIVNIEKITAFTNNDLEIGKDEFPIGAKYRHTVENALKHRLI